MGVLGEAADKAAIHGLWADDAVQLAFAIAPAAADPSIDAAPCSTVRWLMPSPPRASARREVPATPRVAGVVEADEVTGGEGPPGGWTERQDGSGTLVGAGTAHGGAWQGRSLPPQRLGGRAWPHPTETRTRGREHPLSTDTPTSTDPTDDAPIEVETIEIDPDAPPPSFEELGVDADLIAALKVAGIDAPFPIQAITIADALTGRDLCGKAKTGSGKTLAFGLPLLMRTPVAEPGHPTALVLVPTRELADQVHQVLRPLADSRGQVVRAFYGGTSLDRDRTRLQHRIDAVIATPGRLIDLVQQGVVDLDKIAVIVLDEADRMADMGFTPQVEWLLRHVTGPHQTLLFSATLDGDVDHLVKRYQTDPIRHEVISTAVTVDEMTHRFLYVHQMDKPKLVSAISRSATRTLVFVRTKRGADRLVEQLIKEGINAGAIHGDLRQAAREKALRQFTEGSLPVLVATDVAARGLHIEGVDCVIHWDPPEDEKSYLHRSGRTARAGQAGLVVSLVLWDQRVQTDILQKRLRLSVPVVEMFSNDKRLADLTAWEPAAADAVT